MSVPITASPGPHFPAIHGSVGNGALGTQAVPRLGATHPSVAMCRGVSQHLRMPAAGAEGLLSLPGAPWGPTLWPWASEHTFPTQHLLLPPPRHRVPYFPWLRDSASLSRNFPGPLPLCWAPPHHVLPQSITAAQVWGPPGGHWDPSRWPSWGRGKRQAGAGLERELAWAVWRASSGQRTEFRLRIRGKGILGVTPGLIALSVWCLWFQGSLS